MQKFIEELEKGTGSSDPTELLRCKMPSGGIIGQALVKRSSQDYDTKWYDVLTPDDNVSEKDIETFIAELMVEFGTGTGIDPSKVIISCRMPAGGTTGQVLVKKSNDDHDTKWANVSDYVNNKIPSGGKPGQVLVKYSTKDYDLSWADIDTSSGGGGGTIIGDCKVPTGGTQGQILAKKSNSNFDLIWVDAPKNTSGSSGNCKMPAGGTKGQILAKKSGNDFDAEWVNAPSGTGGSTLSGKFTCIGTERDPDLMVGGIWFKVID